MLGFSSRPSMRLTPCSVQEGWPHGQAALPHRARLHPAPGVCRVARFRTALSCISLILHQSHSHVHKPDAPPSFSSMEPAWEGRRCRSPAKWLEGREEPPLSFSFQWLVAEGFIWDEKESSDQIASLSAPPEHALAAG